MAVSTTHPTHVTLREFAHGRLDQDAEMVVYAHIESCGDCRRVAAELSGDDLIQRLMAISSRSGTPAPAKSLSGLVQAVADSPSQSTDIPPELASAAQYEVVRELGRGGMGVVYLARNTLLARTEVLKVVARDFLDRPGAADRFLREMQLAARLQHPNVVTAYNALRLGDLLAFAMEHVDGQDLTVVVRGGGPLPIRTACLYARQVAQGLQHAVERGLVHRDIKPSNLMLVKEGKRHMVKVLDFGLAKAVSEKVAGTDLTGSGRVLGTPDYMAPEQIRDAASARTTADVYSLGGTLFFLLTGTPPYRAASLADLFDAHRFSPPPWLPEFRADAPKELATVLARMIAKDPAERFQSPGEVAQALTPFLTTTSTSAPPSAVRVAISVPSESPSAAPGGSGLVRRASVLSEAAAEPVSQSRSRLSSSGDGLPVKARSGVGKKSRRRRSGRGHRSSSGMIAALIAAGVFAVVSVLGAALWAGGAFRLKTESGSEIVLTGLPADADVFVDGEKVTVTAGKDEAVISAVEAGDHTVRVVRNGVELTASDVTVPLDGSPVRVRVAPQLALTGSGSIPPSTGSGQVARPTVPRVPTLPKPPTIPKVSPPPGAPNYPPFPDAEPEDGFVSLFDGTNLSAWEGSVPGRPPSWAVVDGTMMVDGDQVKESAVTRRSDFANFHLRFDLQPFPKRTGSTCGIHIRKPVDVSPLNTVNSGYILQIPAGNGYTGINRAGRPADA